MKNEIDIDQLSRRYQSLEQARDFTGCINICHELIEKIQMDGNMPPIDKREYLATVRYNLALNHVKLHHFEAALKHGEEAYQFKNDLDLESRTRLLSILAVSAVEIEKKLPDSQVEQQTFYLKKNVKYLEEWLSMIPPTDPNFGAGQRDLKRNKSIIAENESRGKGGCFIATACYGSYRSPEVMVLRQFRDEYLMPSFWGLLLVKCYYLASPKLATQLRKWPSMAQFVRQTVLDKLVIYLRKEG